MVLSKKSLFTIIVFVVTFFTLGRCNLADTNWQLDNNSTDLSDAEEIELGKQVDKYIKNQFYLENDSELNKAVNNIAERLVAVSDRKELPFTCIILQSYFINAFSAPGGHIYLTYGLLKFAKTEDEVAGIIGHEIAHASLRHVSKLYHEIMEILSQQDKETDAITTLLLLNSHLEQFEQDADTVGVLYAQKAGYNPNGLPDFLERHLNLIIQKRMFGILGFSSSETITSRINHLREYIPTLEKEK